MVDCVCVRVHFCVQMCTLCIRVCAEEVEAVGRADEESVLMLPPPEMKGSGGGGVGAGA